MQKTRLAEAVQACEAATASISRPSSPLETSITPIRERELIVRAKLEDLIDQVQDHMSEAAAQVGELEQLQEQKGDLTKWIAKHKTIVSDFESKPCKLRLDMSNQELNTLNDILTAVGDKRSEFLTTLRVTLTDEERAITNKLLDDLETDVMNVIAKKQREQKIIEDYRNYLQGTQSWFDTLAKRIDVSAKGCGLTCAQKVSAIAAINNEFHDEGPQKMETLKQLASQVGQVISNLEVQQVYVQIKSIQRRYADIEKRLSRKIQLFETTTKHMDTIKDEINQLEDLFKEKLSQVENLTPSDYTAKAANQLVQDIKNIQREVDSKQSLIDTIEKRISNIHYELEPIELLLSRPPSPKHEEL